MAAPPPASSSASLPSLSPGSEKARRARARRRALLRNTRHVLLLGALLAALVAAVLALRPRPVGVDAVPVRRGPLTVAIEEDGVTRVKDRYVVSMPVTGRVSRLPFEPGDPVEEGQILAGVTAAESPLLDERTRAESEARVAAALSAHGRAKAELERARAAEELARQDAVRARKLHASGAIAAQALEQAEFQARMRADELVSAEFAVKVAAEEVRIARAALAGGARRSSGRPLHVLSPVSGKILRVHQKSAAVLAAGTPLLEVGDPAALEGVVDLLTTDAVHVRPGTDVQLRGWGGDTVIRGKVHRVEPSAFTRPSALGVDEQRVNVIIAPADPREAWSALGDGYRIEARIEIWHAEDVLKVPHGAVFRYGDGWAAFRLEDGRARRGSVQVGHRGDKEVEILAGLSEGSLVAVHPGDRVQDGVRVSVRSNGR